MAQPKAKSRKKNSRLKAWEVALVKAMIQRGGYNDQEIQSYFTRPTRTVNHRDFSEIRKGAKHVGTKPASKELLDAFLLSWPNLDPETGLSRDGDELLIKAREAMIAAVQTFNGAGLTFRAELFIVTAVIAWTYLMHEWYRRQGIDYRYPKKKPADEDRYWELGKCLRHAQCPIASGVVTNLDFILNIRHEIEHRSTGRIDDHIGRELQACCLNFNEALKTLFGPQYGLEKRLPIALQFVSFGEDQRTRLKQASDLPPHVASFINAFEHGLTDEQIADPAFRYRVAFVPIAANRAASADRAIEFIKPGSPEAEAVSQVLLKEVNKKRYRATDIVSAVQKAGFPKFSIHTHTQFWKAEDARLPEKGFGCPGDNKGSWVWFDSWKLRVLEECEAQGDLYR